LDGYYRFIIEVEDAIHLVELANDKEINLSSLVRFNTIAFRKVLNLFKIRRIKPENLVTSGAHDNEPMNFVETAMSNFRFYFKA
jgi:hypothetical protein